jgi:ABC-type hemin transport system substrate-binding protein
MGAQRIVSLAPSITEILFALRLEPRVVGVTEVCNYPPRRDASPKVGDYQISPEKGGPRSEPTWWSRTRC